MPYLQEQRATQRVTLATEGFWVDLYTDGLRYKDLKQMSTVGEDGTVKVDLQHTTDASLTALIADWNLDDAAGAKLPIDTNSLDTLSQKDAEILLVEIGKILSPETDEQKKSSSKA